jgi:hypothetical protein
MTVRCRIAQGITTKFAIKRNQIIGPYYRYLAPYVVAEEGCRPEVSLRRSYWLRFLRSWQLEKQVASKKTASRKATAVATQNHRFQFAPFVLIGSSRTDCTVCRISCFLVCCTICRRSSSPSSLPKPPASSIRCHRSLSI